MSMLNNSRGNDDSLENNDQQLELLVDGALSEPQRRKLLANLDTQPGGWRRCALAFLEDQCLKESLRPRSGETATKAAKQADSALGAAPPALPNAATPVQPVGTRTRQRKSPLARIGTVLAMAASFLVAALYVGSLWQPARRGHGPDMQAGSEMLASHAQPGVPVPSLSATQLADAQLPSVPQRPVDVRPQPGAGNAAWHTVAVSLPGGPQGQGQTIQLPALDGGDKVDDAWLRNLPAALPPDVLQALQRTGHEVRQQRDLVPLRMNDGRELVVPVDKVEVHYVGRPAY
jgi:hypothetical protein